MVEGAIKTVLRLVHYSHISLKRGSFDMERKG